MPITRSSSRRSSSRRSKSRSASSSRSQCKLPCRNFNEGDALVSQEPFDSVPGGYMVLPSGNCVTIDYMRQACTNRSLDVDAQLGFEGGYVDTEFNTCRDPYTNLNFSPAEKNMIMKVIHGPHPQPTLQPAYDIKKLLAQNKRSSRSRSRSRSRSSRSRSRSRRSDSRSRSRSPTSLLIEAATRPLRLAEQLFSVRQLLRDGADANATDGDGRTTLYSASLYGNTDVVKLLLEHGADADKATTTTGVTPLFIASQNGKTDVVKLLLEHGADADKATTDGATPLFQASANGHTGVVQLLLAHGADANKAETTEGATPLLVASEEGRTNIVELLLEHGADAAKANEYGTTPLDIASHNGHTDVVTLLRRRIHRW